MHPLDWSILLATLGFIVGYGVWKTRRTNTVSRYLRGDNEDRWWAVTLSVMATQASAITFLSTPGQGFLEGAYHGHADAISVVVSGSRPDWQRQHHDAGSEKHDQANNRQRLFGKHEFS